MTIPQLIEKSQKTDGPGPISRDQVDKAWADRYMEVNTREEAFYFLCCINLLNAAIKREAFREGLYYGGIKKPLSMFFTQLINGDQDLADDFYLNPEEGPCLYVESFGLQFTFHNVGSKDPSVQEFLESGNNSIKAWKGIRLQWIAGELFEAGLNVLKKANARGAKGDQGDEKGLY